LIHDAIFSTGDIQKQMYGDMKPEHKTLYNNPLQIFLEI